MNPEPVDWAQVVDALGAIRAELDRLGQRVSALEGSVVTPPRAAASTPPAVVGLSEELVLVLSAAIAAFLGKKAHIRQIRLLGSEAWGAQGRVTIQASHVLAVPHS